MQSSYYKSTDTIPFYPEKKLNYLDLLAPQLFMSDYKAPQFESSDTETDSKQTEFSAREYSIKKKQAINYGDNVDRSIAGLLQIMDADPNLKDKYRITSLYRAGATTKQGRTSYHSSGKAVDIVPLDGDFASMEKTIMSNPQIVKYLSDNNLGILDEYSDEGVKRNTGSTGSHMHIGPDKLARTDFQKLLKKHGYS